MRWQLLLAAALVSVGFGAIPKLEGRVTDRAGVFSAAEVQRITQMLADYESETSHQLAVLTVPTLEGETIESFSLRVAKAWRLGRKGADNGMLVTLAMKERAARIELGLGFERYISDADAKRIMDEAMIPAFTDGRFAEGVENGLKRLMDAGRKLVAPRTNG